MTEDTLPPLNLGSWLSKVQRDQQRRGNGRTFKISGEQIRRSGGPRRVVGET